MRRHLNPRSAAIIAIVLLATLAMLAMGSAADKEFDDWRIRSPVQYSDEDITVSGQLTIENIGSLQLNRCNLTFTGGIPEEQRVLLYGGSLMLDASHIYTENGGKISVEGRMEMIGISTVNQMDIWVGSRGSIAFRDADVKFSGIYTSPTDNDPVDLQLGGSATFVDASITLEVAFISSTGTFTFNRSSIESYHDFGWPYVPSKEHLRFDGGTVSLVDSNFHSLYTGIRSGADLEVRDCTFNASALKLHAPQWLTDLGAWVDGCTFTESDLGISLEDSQHETKTVDVLIEDVTIDGGHLVLDLQEAYNGSIVIDGASIKDYSGYGVVVEARGFNGELVLESLDVDGPYGVQVMEDYSGLRLLNSTITAQQTAIDFRGTYPSVPAYVEGVTVSGNIGLKAKTTVVKVVRSDLSLAATPVRGEGGSAITLTDCLLDVEGLDLRVEPGERAASIWVDRHLDIDSVRWVIGDPIEEGTVLFYIYSELTLLRDVKEWTIGSDNPPLIRLLQWSMFDEGPEDKLVFDNVEPAIFIDGNTFEPDDDFTLNPWEAGPFELIFKDDVNPWLAVSGDVPTEINDPEWVIYGTCGDAGTGIEGVSWVLYTPLGELVSSGDVDYLSDGRWQTTIYLTGDMQVVHLFPKDRSGNEELVPLQRVDVTVPPPMLTVVRPDGNLLTNVEFITVSGTADFYAHEVHVQVLGHDEVETIPVIAGRYSMIFNLPQEGLNDLIISSHDPYGGFDEKRVSVHLDTIAPVILLDDLDTAATNHLNNPSLVITGKTDDSRATITVLGQEVGLVGIDFATTVSLVEGGQTIKLRAMDEAGNENLINLKVVLDTSIPMLTLVNPKVSPFWSTEYEVEVVLAVDETLGTAIINGEIVDVVDGQIYHLARLGNGPYIVDVHVTDLAGNEAIREVVLRLDNEPPTLNFVSPRPGQIVNTTAVPIIVVTSEAGCSLFMDDGTHLIPMDTSENDIGRLMGVMYMTPGEGERTITFVIKDRAGNTVTEDLDLDIDTVIPFLDIPGFHDGMMVTTEPLKVKGFTEPGSKVVWVNGQMATLSADGKFSTVLEPEEGWQDVRFVVLDRAGNHQEETYRIKALGEPSFDPPIEALAAGTILVTLGALAVTTEIGRWSLLSFFVPLYTKLRKDKILDQRTRGLIEGYITANPGANYTIIRDNLDLADGTLTYHLQVLEREGYVYSIREGLFRCFYPQGVPPPRRGKLHLSDTQADLIRIVKRIPGITVGEIATAMNRRPNVISYHLKLLKEGGLVRMEEDGRHVRVYPIDTAVAMI